MLTEQTVAAGPAFVEMHDQRAQGDWAKVRDSGIGDMLAGYNLTLALAMVEQSGMARKLLGDGGCGRAALLEGLDPAMGEGLVDYLAIRGVIAYAEDDAVVPTDRGRLLLSDVPMALLGYYHEAYAPVLRRGASLLDGTLAYGTHLGRDGEALGRHCEVLFRSFGTRVVTRMLDAMEAHCVLDLGCGSGGLLIDACRQNPALRGIGLDVSPEVVRYGQQRVAAAGMSHRVRVVEGDAFRPETWPEECGEADAILTVGTLHEHFRHGEEAVIEVLNAYADFLGERGRGVVLAEPELYRDARDADFYLIHTFTRQGYPRRHEDWCALFERSRLRCREVVQVPETGFRFVYFNLVPA
jgi:SAM-dependent methyltransferase